MTALNMERASHIERWKHHSFPLAAGTKAWKGGLAVIDTATGKCKPGVAGAGMFYIGKFDETVDAIAAEKPVSVDLGVEIEVVWWNNDTVAPVTAAMVGQAAYVLDDQTVSSVGTSRSLAGRVWAVDVLYGVAVQKVSAAPAGSTPVGEAGGGEEPPLAGRAGGDTELPPSSRRGAADVRPGDVRPGDVRPGDVRPGDVRPGDVRPGDVRTEHEVPSFKPNAPPSASSKK